MIPTLLVLVFLLAAPTPIAQIVRAPAMMSSHGELWFYVRIQRKPDQLRLRVEAWLLEAVSWADQFPNAVDVDSQGPSLRFEEKELLRSTDFQLDTAATMYHVIWRKLDPGTYDLVPKIEVRPGAWQRGQAFRLVVQ